ncbi:hypothetical protein [Nocardia sp. NRRL S-836]|uniref:hypothetical protein n=1 Tax=Nocardia sp. NRRL S-836 TaxID=1519492 RepID=UPI000A5908C1|nr:hypothetical protein [Nocardia sp. NRRL S-836]
MNRTRRILTAAACLPAALLIGLGMAGTASAQTVNCPSVNLNGLASVDCKVQVQDNNNNNVIMIMVDGTVASSSSDLDRLLDLLAARLGING